MPRTRFTITGKLDIILGLAKTDLTKLVSLILIKQYKETDPP